MMHKVKSPSSTNFITAKSLISKGITQKLRSSTSLILESKCQNLVSVNEMLLFFPNSNKIEILIHVDI